MDWYRKTTWEKKDRLDFEERLARSRSQRTQYIKIQASYLESTKDPELALPAVRLAEQYLKEEPGGFFEVQAYLIKACALATLKDVEGAVSSYRRATELESVSNSGARECAYLDYALFVARNSLFHHFKDAHEWLGQMRDEDLMFPVSQLKFFGSLAIFLDHWDDPREAKKMASMALAPVAKSSPFKHHPGAGVVPEAAEPFLKRLGGIAASPTT